MSAKIEDGLTRSQRHYRKDPARRKLAQQKYREKHLDRLRESKRKYQRRYVIENREKVLEQKKISGKKYREVHRSELSLKNVGRNRKYALHKYGLTEERFQELVTLSGNRCCVCRRGFSKKNRPHVDHCHKTGFMRGLLCSNCNTAEGLLKRPEVILNLYKYVIKNELFYQGTS